MVKTRLSKVLAMLLALTMVLSTMVIDFTAFAANADVAFTVTAKVDDADYNKGETVTVKYYAKAAEATAIGSYQFKVAYDDEKLELVSLASDLTGASQVNETKGIIAWARNTAADVTIGTEDTLIATATFTAIHNDTTTDSVSATAIEITPKGYDGNVAPTVVPTAVNLWNITVTFSGDEGIENDVAGTAYVKYGVAGLYTSNAYDAEYTPVVAEAKDTYRLEDENAYWKVSGVEDYKTAAEIAVMTFTANATAVATTVKQYTISFALGENGTLDGEAPEAIVVDKGTDLGTLELPEDAYKADAGYVFAGWSVDGQIITVDGYLVDTKDITLTATFADGQYTWSYSAPNATLEVEDGVTGNAIKHGEDIIFTVEANPGYVVSEVRYSVDGADKGELQAADNVYTINGAAITGNIAVEVVTLKYHTVTFVDADGATFTTDKLTAYVVDGQSKLYASPEELAAGGDSTFALPAYTVDNGYRADDSQYTYRWTIGQTNYSDVGVGAYVFNEATTIKPYVIKYWVITFKLGANGKWADGATEDVVLNIDDGAAITGYKQPIADTGEGYVFSAWDDDPNGDTATAAKTYTANFVAGTYDFTFASATGINVTDVSGVENDTATFGQDVKFKLEVNGTLVTLESVTYTVNGKEPVVITKDQNDYYTVPGTAITDTTTVGFNTTGMVAVTFAATNGTVSTTTIYVKSGETLTQDQLEEVNAQPNAHYEIDAILDGEEVTTVDALLEKEVTAPFTVTYTYKLIEYNFDDAGYTVVFEDGFSTPSNTKDLKFKVTKTGEIVLGVKYQVDEAEAVAATFDAATGIYTIPGANITGDIALVVDAVEGTIDFIARNDYKAIVTENAGKKILVVTTGKIDGKAYQYKGSNMFWSSKYGAYVAWVADTDTAELVAGYLTVANEAAVEIAYDGDINNSGTVTAADAGIINDCLHDQRVSDTSDKMLFELDYDVENEGIKVITTADSVKALNKAVE